MYEPALILKVMAANGSPCIVSAEVINQVTPEVTPEVPPQFAEAVDRLLAALEGEVSRQGLQWRRRIEAR